MIALVGDLGQVMTPCLAGSYSLYNSDWKGIAYLAAALIINQIAVELLKSLVPHQRPNGSPRSFPSGHTTAAFLGAGFIAKRYGIAPSIPAFAIAILVGYSRVYTKAHWVSDVCAGALIGLVWCLPLKRFPSTK